MYLVKSGAYTYYQSLNYGARDLYGNVERVFRSGPDSIYLYTNTILNINLQSSDRTYTYMATTATCLYTLRGANGRVMWAYGNRLPPPFVSQEF